jgi:5-formyltetrahydrofolate cyclo-ligase
MEAKELRAKYKALRSQLSENDIETMSLAITNLLLTLPIWEKTYFHIFLPITEQKEVDTELILHLLSGKTKKLSFQKLILIVLR